MKLSDGPLVRRTSSDTGGEGSSARRTASGGARPARARRPTGTPRRSSASSNAWAANSAGLAWK
jgi:hypothetical protein